MSLYPVAVQGESAALQMIKALDYFQENHAADVVIIGRGGGSFEDLNCFNDERLARRIYNFDIPIISAVGHETDFTICDFVADVREATPSTAATRAVPDKISEIEKLQRIKLKLQNRLNTYMQNTESNLLRLTDKVSGLNPNNKLVEAEQQLDIIYINMRNAILKSVDMNENRIYEYKRIINSLNPKNTLKRGYAIIKNGNSEILTAISDVKNAGKVSIHMHDGYAGAMTVVKLPKLASAAQYGEGLWQAFANDGITPSNDIYGSGSTPVIPAFLDAQNTIPSANTDWLGALFNSALVTSHNISFSSGTEASNSFFSVGYYKQDGILKDTGFDRYTFRANTNFKLGSMVTVGENFSVSFSNNTDVNTNSLLGSPIYGAFLMPSIAPIYNINGEFTGYPLDDIQNPLGALTRNRNNEDKTLRLFGNVFAEIQLAKGLKFKTNYGLTLSNFSGTNFNPTFTEPNVQRVLADLTKSEQNLLEWTFTNTINYDATFNDKHNLNLLAGYESIESSLETLSAFRQGFPGNDPNFQVLNAGDSGTQQNTNMKFENSLVSYFGKANYSYDDRYLASYTIRRDGTSKLANNKWGTFSAASLGWKISNEAFYRSELVNSLKLRLGWGQNGNQDIPPYVTSSGYFSNAYNSNYAIDGAQNSVFNGYIISRNSNPDLKWETTEQYNIGIDLGLMSNRLDLTLDYFSKNTEDLLLERQLAPISGGTNSSVWDNVGAMNNKGFELGANYRNDYDRELQFSAGLNMSIIRNELTSLKEGVDFVGIDAVTLHSNNFDQEVSRTAVGQPIASFYGWVADGIFQDQSEIDAHSFQNASTSPGDIRFKDINNDNVIDDKDRAFIGNPHPDFSLNLNLNFEYKNFDLSAFFRSSFGNDVYDLTRYYSDFYNLSSYNKHSRIADAWTTSNTGTSIPRLSLNDPNNNIRPSSYYVKDGTFVKLQTLQLGYNFNPQLIEDFSLSKFRLYVNLQNVFTITGYDGIDPEIGLQNYSSDDRNLDIGVDRAIYPPSRTVTLGLNIAF